MLTSERYWCFPELLRAKSVETILLEYYCLDPFNPIVYVILSSMSSKNFPTFHDADSSLLGFYCWKNDRRTWTTDSNLARLFSTHLRVNNDFDFDRILPVFPCTKRMQWTRMLLPLLPRYVRL